MLNSASLRYPASNAAALPDENLTVLKLEKLLISSEDDFSMDELVGAIFLK